ncbi:MAG: Unknown protein [uncultured Sulfurovum sp.]|uniref:Lipoprotein n=1 Tax=uncultured Sulfurovum sp. TaxID=269237 RepID=A0A6S6T7J3_9BACT|nr:MAG: Unknown protein [uncultured Sulfurovum sp.]
MHYILLLIFALFFTACNPATLENGPTPDSSPLPVSKQNTDVNDLKIIDEDSIVGSYMLKRGMFRNQEITEGYLTVEEIDVNNYGYYYVTISGKLSPETHTGIFYKKGGQYVQKVIEDSSELEIRQGKKKSKMSIIDNMQIKQEDKLLKIYINSTKKEKLIWKRDLDDIKKSEAMIKALKNAQYEYQLYYKEKCSESEEFCGDSEYTKVNDSK